MKPSPTTTDRRWTWLLIALAAAGCAPSQPKPVKVVGRVTLAGGQWPKPGRLTFFPMTPVEGFPKMPGFCEFDNEGAFAVQTLRIADGLMPGKYQVGVECWDEWPTDIKPAGKNPHVADKYRNPKTSGLEFVVPLEGVLDARLDVPTR